MGRDTPEEQSDTSGLVGTWYPAKVNPLQQRVLHQLHFVCQNYFLYDTSPVGVLKILALANMEMDTRRVCMSYHASLHFCLAGCSSPPVQ